MLASSTNGSIQGSSPLQEEAVTVPTLAIIIVGVVVLALGILEWRSWTKPMAPGLNDWWGGNPNRGGDRGITGGHHFDQPHD